MESNEQNEPINKIETDSWLREQDDSCDAVGSESRRIEQKKKKEEETHGQVQQCGDC